MIYFVPKVHVISREDLATGIRLDGDARMTKKSVSVALGDIEPVGVILDQLSLLMAAIGTHRQNVWGDGEVGHDEDVDLYSVLDSAMAVLSSHAVEEADSED